MKTNFIEDFTKYNCTENIIISLALLFCNNKIHFFNSHLKEEKGIKVI